MPANLRLVGLMASLLLGSVGCGQEPPPAIPLPPAPEAPAQTPQTPIMGNDPVVPVPGPVTPSTGGPVGPKLDVPWGDLDHPVVVIKDNRYHPYYVRVRMGGSVTWINQDRVTQSVTSPIPGGATQEGDWEGVLAPGERYTRIFNRYTGTFTYHSRYTSDLRGNVIVVGDRRQDLFWSELFRR